MASPTFSEIWYRVADLRPRLSVGAEVRRQTFRGRPWYVVADAYGHRFFRLHRSAWDVVGRLDGTRTVDEVWRTSLARQGDAALTQDEVVRLLSQLFSANLVQGDVPPDAEALFRRQRKKERRERVGRFANVLFLRFPLVDPDRVLDRWTGVFGRLFAPAGLAGLVAFGILCAYVLAARAPELASRAASVLSPEALPLLYLGLVLVKGLHELGHAFAAKHFARVEGGRGEIHAMGIALLVFVPLPFVDVSCAWGLRSRWRRAGVGAAGVLVEFACAGVAALVWANTGPGTVNDLAYDFLWIASVSTLLFNGNPLLRYDGYYVLSDLIEIPNLALRSNEYLGYLVKRYVWRVPGIDSPADGEGEALWLGAYGLAAGAFRIFVCGGILLFVADRWFFFGAFFAAASLVAWGVLPLLRLGSYLATDPELDRVRPRAIATTALAAVVVLAELGLVPVPERCRVDAVAMPREWSEVHAAEDGFVGECLAAGALVSPGGAPLAVQANPELSTRRAECEADLRAARARQRVARQEGDLALVGVLAEEISALEARLAQTDEALAKLTLHAPGAGTWVVDEPGRWRGAFLRRGAAMGTVATVDDVEVRAVADQQTAARIIEAGERVRVRLRPVGRPDRESGGTVLRILPEGSKQLPSPALGVEAGGNVQTAGEDPSGTEAAERQFTIVIAPDDASGLRPGQRVAVRFDLPSRPLLFQGWQAFRRLVQRRFRV